ANAQAWSFRRSTDGRSQNGRLSAHCQLLCWSVSQEYCRGAAHQRSLQGFHLAAEAFSTGRNRPQRAGLDKANTLHHVAMSSNFNHWQRLWRMLLAEILGN
ncbi:MAG TPA: hypothetical protein VKY92_10075, partial [Verrucomicrobiae bacterium]|nr:hypothetical protein [Verrucomicrobiae bacterium]